jgi:prepilin peptidase CpaA
MARERPVPTIEVLRFAIGAAATVLLTWAAVSDIRARRIPNLCVLALIILFVPWALLGDLSDTLSALEAAGIALVVTVLLYTFKILGAGDSKLLTACALYAGMGYLPFLALATVLAGGVIAAVSLASRPQRTLAMFTLRGKGDYGRGVPYGVAVAVGACLAIWGNLTGTLNPYGYGGPTPVTGHTIARALSMPRATP